MMEMVVKKDMVGCVNRLLGGTFEGLEGVAWYLQGLRFLSIGN